MRLLAGEVALAVSDAVAPALPERFAGETYHLNGADQRFKVVLEVFVQIEPVLWINL